MNADRFKDPVPVPKMLVSTKEAAARLSICPRTLWSISAPRGNLPVVRIGKKMLYHVADLEREIEARKVRSGNGGPVCSNAGRSLRVVPDAQT
jgi:hypothetical protein